MVKRWKRGGDTASVAVGQPGDLRIGSLLDDPALRRTLGLDPSEPTAVSARPVSPDGRTASMLRAAQYGHAA